MFRPKRRPRGLTVLLVLALIAAAGWSGTALAAYVKQNSLFGSGWVGPKYYAFEVESSATGAKLAPGESADYPFSVKNFNSGGTAQVPLKVLIKADYPASLAGTGKVRADLYSGSTLLKSSETGTLECAGFEMTANIKETHSYTLTLTWLDADISLLSGAEEDGLGTEAVYISVSGYQ